MDGMNREKWNSMTKAQKREHIWEYYKFHIISVIAVVLVGSWLIYEKVNYVEPTMRMVMTNVVERKEDDSCFREFMDKYGYEGTVEMNQTLYFDFENAAQLMQNGRNYEALVSMFSLSEYDIFFANPEVYASCAIDGAMLDLSILLPAELLEKHKDRLLYTDEDGLVEKAYPCGVNLEGNPWANGNKLYYKGYAGIMKNTADVEMATNFMIYLLEQFDKEAAQ